MDLSLTNVINISVAAAQAGVGDYNTSNLALFTHEVYDPSSFGDDGYKIYLSPTEVAEDFGSDSQTFAMANSVFSQKPNILAGNGYLVIIPMNPEVQGLTFSGGTPASGSFVLNYDGNASAAIAWDDTASEIETKLRAVPGLEFVNVTGGPAPTAFAITMDGVYGNVALLTITSNTLQTGGASPVTPAVAQTTAGETIAGAITRASDLVQFFGIIGTVIYAEADMLAAAAVVQALNKIFFAVSDDAASVEIGGYLDLITTGGFTQTRGLYYGSTESAALVMMAAYASRGLSTNFDGSNTTSTMHLKDLLGVQPDPSMTQTLLVKCIDAGADTYVSLQGVPKVFTSGENQYFDQVYNLQWFVGALQVAGFNFLAQSSTKVPQTENGMDGLKAAYRNVCEQAVTNAYSAPGVWNSSTTFGNQSDFLENIAQRGYYIYSQPIAQQSQSQREARNAPLVQIALKEAGAIQKSNVIVYVNP